MERAHPWFDSLEASPDGSAPANARLLERVRPAYARLRRSHDAAHKAPDTRTPEAEAAGDTSRARAVANGALTGGIEAAIGAVMNDVAAADNMSIIDEFIAGGEHRIVADECTPEYIDGVDAAPLVADDGLVTEALAEIYLKQGLKGEAIEIYRALGLLNPEKSIYFAEIIEKIK